MSELSRIIKLSEGVINNNIDLMNFTKYIVESNYNGARQILDYYDNLLEKEYNHLMSLTRPENQPNYQTIIDNRLKCEKLFNIIMENLDD